MLNSQNKDDNELEVKANTLRPFKKDILVVVTCVLISHFVTTEAIEFHL